jgi:hypothetical protein
VAKAVSKAANNGSCLTAPQHESKKTRSRPGENLFEKIITASFNIVH